MLWITFANRCLHGRPWVMFNKQIVGSNFLLRVPHYKASSCSGVRLVRINLFAALSTLFAVWRCKRNNGQLASLCSVRRLLAFAGQISLPSCSHLTSTKGNKKAISEKQIKEQFAEQFDLLPLVTEQSNLLTNVGKQVKTEDQKIKNPKLITFTGP